MSEQNQSEVKAPEVAKLDPAQKAGVLQAVAQLEMFSQLFVGAPERVLNASKEFIESLKEWAQ